MRKMLFKRSIGFIGFVLLWMGLTIEVAKAWGPHVPPKPVCGSHEEYVGELRCGTYHCHWIGRCMPTAVWMCFRGESVYVAKKKALDLYRWGLATFGKCPVVPPPSDPPPSDPPPSDPPPSDPPPSDPPPSDPPPSDPPPSDPPPSDPPPSDPPPSDPPPSDPPPDDPPPSDPPPINGGGGGGSTPPPPPSNPPAEEKAVGGGVILLPHCSCVNAFAGTDPRDGRRVVRVMCSTAGPGGVKIDSVRPIGYDRFRYDWKSEDDGTYLTIPVPDSAPAGHYWFRAYNGQGESGLCEGDLPENPKKAELPPPVEEKTPPLTPLEPLVCPLPGSTYVPHPALLRRYVEEDLIRCEERIYLKPGKDPYWRDEQSNAPSK